MSTTEKGSHGAGILHKQKPKMYNLVSNLASPNDKVLSKTAGILVFGADGGMNFANAFSNVFQHAQHFCCDIHLKDNIERKLTEYGIVGVHANRNNE